MKKGDWMGTPNSAHTMNLGVGEVVQIGVDERIREPFRGKLGFIEEIKGWGLVVRVETFEGDAYYRVEWGHFAEVGFAGWHRKMGASEDAALTSLPANEGNKDDKERKRSAAPGGGDGY